MTVTLDPYNNIINYLKNSDFFNKQELEDVFYNNANKVYFTV